MSKPITLYRVHGYVPDVGQISRNTQARSERQALRFIAEWIKQEFWLKRGRMPPKKMFLGYLTVEKMHT